MDQYQEAVRKFDELLKEPVDVRPYNWSKKVAERADVMLRVNRVLDSEALGLDKASAANLKTRISEFCERCSDQQFHIALVGTIKAGKSTLVNALIDKDIASTEVTPETATLTIFKKSSENCLEVSYYSSEEWNSIWQKMQSLDADKKQEFLEEYHRLNADACKDQYVGREPETFVCTDADDIKRRVAEYTSSKSSAQYFVKEVVVGLKDFFLPDNVLLVDTPGLDDIIEYRSNITKDYIKKANCVLTCIAAQAMTGNENFTLTKVFDIVTDRSKVLVIGTQLDKLNNPEKDWMKQKKNWLRSLEISTKFASKELAEENTIGVTAYLYNLLNKLRDKKLSEDEELTLLSIGIKNRCQGLDQCLVNYEKLIAATYIRKVRSKILEIIKNRQSAMENKIIKDYYNAAGIIEDKLTNRWQSCQQIIAMILQDNEKLQAALQEYENKVQQMHKDQDELKQNITKFKQESTKMLNDLMQKIKNTSVYQSKITDQREI